MGPNRRALWLYPVISAATEVHKATLCILAFSTAHVMTVDELKALIEHGTVRAKRKKAA
jgi:hypothetical protein